MISDTQHRPWALPNRRWAMAMDWHDLLFMHWPILPELLRPLIPPALAIDCFDGTAWIGVVPFRMSGVRPRYTPALPWMSAFPELNVRTYVESDGKPGVWFFSLDAANPVAVWAARRSFYLPYYHARMTVEEVDGGFRYQSHRVHRRAPSAAFAGSYRPIAPVYHAAPGTLDHWLTERYCLYAADPRGRLYRGDIHHSRWPLQAAEAAIDVNTMTDAVGLNLPEMEPLLHFASRLEVVAWHLTAVG